ncbi:hypothetical protein ACFYU8_17585 [Brevibacillus sp. NPDC003359]|uniref:hypothetical protein n=1 Tax=unclassified Brevibacillus TaxID=2684853 RepID=UPI00367894FB
MYENKNLLIKNGKETSVANPPRPMTGAVLVPLVFIAQELGAKAFQLIPKMNGILLNKIATSMRRSGYLLHATRVTPLLADSVRGFLIDSSFNDFYCKFSKISYNKIVIHSLLINKEGEVLL